MPTVIRNFERPPASLIEEMKAYPPSTIHEAQNRLGALDSAIKPVAPGMSFCGPALTVSCAIGDNLMIFEAMMLAQPGDVIVLSAGNNPQQGGFGEVIATAFEARGIAALVVDAGVRDGAALRRKGFPVFSLGLSMKGTVKETLGSINHPIVIGGQLVRPGDVVSGDDDGVVVVRREDAAEIARLSRVREDEEAVLIASLRSGVPMNIENRRALMKAKGATWSD